MQKVNKKIVKIFAETPGFFFEGPFTTTSGRVCPIYPDFRLTLSFPEYLKIIAEEMVKELKKRKIKFDIVLGGATAGIQISSAISLLTGKLSGYVRKAPKDGGLCRAVEGYYEPGMTALIVDDAAGSGDAKVKFIDNARAAGLKVDHIFVTASRTRTGKKERAWIKEKKVELLDFCDTFDIIKEARKSNIITKEAAQCLTWYMEDAGSWNKDQKKWKFFEDYMANETRNSKTGI